MAPSLIEKRQAEACIKAGGMWDFFGGRGCVARTASYPTNGAGNGASTRSSTVASRTNLPTLFAGTRQPAYGFSSLQPGTFPGPTVYSSPGSATPDPFGSLTNAGCGFITNPNLRALCIAAGGILTGTLAGGGGGTGSGEGGSTAVTCPPGYRSDGRGGCQLEGIGPYLPGDVGRQDYGWQAVNGRYGAGVGPIATQRQRLVCPPGYALGKDNICYDRVRKSDRKWNPGTKPFLTGGEVNAIRRAKRLRKKFVRLSSGKSALFPTAKTKAPRKGRRR